MQPLQLPPSISPPNSNTWKSWDNHLNNNINNTCHSTTNYINNIDNINSKYITDSNHINNHMMYNNETSYQICDPYTYSQIQFQLQYQQLLIQQQQQQQQQQQLHAQLQQLQERQLAQQLSISPQKSSVHSSVHSLSPQKPSITAPAINDSTSANKTCIEKIFLNAKFVTAPVFNHLSIEIPKLTCHDIYEGFFVAPNPTGYEWDMILKVYYKNRKENKTYIKYYLMHQEFALRGNRSSGKLFDHSRTQMECIQYELEMPLTLFNEFDHVVSYMYGSDIYIGDSHLIALYVLMDRLSIGGGILEELLYEIRRCCDKYHCVSFLLESEALLCEELVWLCGDSILQNLSTISYYEWLEIPDTAFNRLIFQAVSSGIDKYSDFIVCELIMQYIKAIMSESHEKAKDIIRNLDSTDIKCVSLDHSLPLLKICDVLFAHEKQTWRYKNITVYKLSLNKVSKEFTPYHNELCQQLQGLSPITFAQILIDANHLLQNALKLSLMAYKEGNHAAYYNDKHLRISRILSQRKKNGQKEKEVVLVMDKNKIELECENGEKNTIVSPLEIDNSSLNNIGRSRSPPKSPSKSPQYSVENNEFSPCSVHNAKEFDECSQFIYSSPLNKRNTYITNNNNTQFDNAPLENAQFDDVAENALILKLIQ